MPGAIRQKVGIVVPHAERNHVGTMIHDAAQKDIIMPGGLCRRLLIHRLTCITYRPTVVYAKQDVEGDDRRGGRGVIYLPYEGR
jgi:hypothetical protein